MERACRDEQDVRRAHGAVARLHGAPFDERQEVALHAAATHVRSAVAPDADHLVEFVEEHDPGLLGAPHCFARDHLLVEQAVRFLRKKRVARAGDRELAIDESRRRHAIQEPLHVHAHLLDAHRREHLHRSARAVFETDLDAFVVEFAGAEARPVLVAPPSAFRSLLLVIVGGKQILFSEQLVEKPFLRLRFRFAFHAAGFLLLDDADRSLHEVAYDRLDVAPEVPDLGVLRRLDFQKRRVQHRRHSAGDLRFADARRPGENDVFGQDIACELFVQPLAPHPVSNRYGDRAFRGRLPHDVAVEIGDNFEYIAA